MLNKEVYNMGNFITKPEINDEKPGISYIGRFDFSGPDGVVFGWSCSTIIARFNGTEVSAKFQSFGPNYFTIILDGKIIMNSLDVSKGGVYVLATNLSNGIHEIKMVKRNEFNIGYVKFLGFDFDDGQLSWAPKHYERRIEVIGDSITCGFGNEGVDESTQYVPSLDNGYLSYGAITGRSLEAETMVIGCSGFGVMQSYDGNISQTVPSRYSMVVPERDIKWDFTSWIPQVVVINLGTNDFSFGSIPDIDKFNEAYIKFIEEIHSNYRNSKIICTVGPLMDGEALKVIKKCINNVILGHFYNKELDFVSFLEFEPQNKEQNGCGVSGHPSIKTHEIMAKTLENKIRKMMNW
jgi:hypothetical protein